jgi:hypothetical protein
MRPASIDHGRYLAAHIDGARYVELPGTDNLIWAGDQARIAEIEEFITGARSTAPADRRLATVLFTDIVGSTSTRPGSAIARGEVVIRHDRLRRRRSPRRSRHQEHRRRILATFDRPGADSARRSSCRDRPAPARRPRPGGAHAGNRAGGADIAGLAVHIAARLGSRGADAILVQHRPRSRRRSGFVFGRAEPHPRAYGAVATVRVLGERHRSESEH